MQRMNQQLLQQATYQRGLNARLIAEPLITNEEINKMAQRVAEAVLKSTRDQTRAEDNAQVQQVTSCNTHIQVNT